LTIRATRDPAVVAGAFLHSHWPVISVDQFLSSISSCSAATDSIELVISGMSVSLLIFKQSPGQAFELHSEGRTFVAVT
jgi:hypothetical protein